MTRQFVIKVKGEDGKEFSSSVLSEGTLRLLTLCILAYDDNYTGLLCIEEPENGVHPFRMKAMAQLLKDLSTDLVDTESPLRQVIVNTHSPVLVNELVQWQKDRNVSIWLSRLNSLITEIEDRKIKTKVTRMSPVLKEYDKDGQLSLFRISERERKLTLAEVTKYLQTADTEKRQQSCQLIWS